MKTIKTISLLLLAITISLFISSQANAYEEDWQYDAFGNPTYHHYLTTFTMDTSIYMFESTERWRYTYGGSDGRTILSTERTYQSNFKKDNVLISSTFQTDLFNSTYRRLYSKTTGYASDGIKVKYEILYSYYYNYVGKYGSSNTTTTYYNDDGSKAVSFSYSSWGTNYTYDGTATSIYNTRGHVISTQSTSISKIGSDLYETNSSSNYTYVYEGNLITSRTISYEASVRKNGVLQYRYSGNSSSDANLYKSSTTWKYYNERGQLTKVYDYTYEYNYKTGKYISSSLTTTYTYYASGNLQSKTYSSPDEFGNIKYEYLDENLEGRGYGRIFRITKGDNSHEIFEYWGNTEMVKTKAVYDEERYDSNGLLIIKYKYEYSEDGRLMVFTEPIAGRRTTTHYDAAGNITGYTKELGNFHSGFPNMYADYVYVSEEYDAGWNRLSASGPMMDLLMRDIERRYPNFVPNWTGMWGQNVPFIMSITTDGTTVILNYTYNIYRGDDPEWHERRPTAKPNATYIIRINGLPKNVHYPARVERVTYADGSRDEYFYEEGASYYYEDRLLRIDAYSPSNKLIAQYFMDQNHNTEYILIYYDNGDIVKVDRNWNIMEMWMANGDHYEYYASGNLKTKTLTHPEGDNVIKYEYIDEDFYGGKFGRIWRMTKLDGSYEILEYWYSTDRIMEKVVYDSSGTPVTIYRYDEIGRLTTNTDMVLGRRIIYKYSGTSSSITGYTLQWGNFPFRYADYVYVSEEYDAGWNRLSASGPMMDLLMRDIERRYPNFVTNWTGMWGQNVPFIMSITTDGTTVILNYTYNIYRGDDPEWHERRPTPKPDATYTIRVNGLPKNVHYPARVERVTYADGSRDEYFYEEGASYYYEDRLLRIDAYSPSNKLIAQYFMDQNHNTEYILIYYDNGDIVKVDRNWNIMEIRRPSGVIEYYDMPWTLKSITLPNGLTIRLASRYYSVDYFSPSGNIKYITSDGFLAPFYNFMDESFYGSTSLGNMGRLRNEIHPGDGRFPGSAGADLYTYDYWDGTDKIAVLSYYSNNPYYYTDFRLLARIEYDINHNVTQHTGYDYYPGTENLESKTLLRPEGDNIKYEYLDEDYYGGKFGRIWKITKVDGSYEIIEYYGDTEEIKNKEVYDPSGNLIVRYEYFGDDMRREIRKEIDGYHIYTFKGLDILMENSPTYGLKIFSYSPSGVFQGYTRIYDTAGGIMIREVYDSAYRLVNKYEEERPFFTGVNLPWLDYGKDIGMSHGFAVPEAHGLSTKRDELDRRLRELAGSVTRIFLFTDLRSGIDIDSSGNIIGFDEQAVRDLKELLNAAEANGVELILTLFDYLLADGQSEVSYWKNGIWVTERLGEYPQFITDPAKRAQLVSAVKDLFDKVGLNSYRSVVGFDIMNEPEWAHDWGGISYTDLQSFMYDFRDMLHSFFPNKFVTVGSKDKNAMLSYWGSGFDFYQFHHYDWMPNDGRQLDIPASSLGLDNGVFAGELQPTAFNDKMMTLYTNGYDGALFWQDTGYYYIAPQDLAGVLNWFVGTIYGYYDSGMLESKTLPKADEGGKVQYEYRDENFQNRGYGRLSRAVYEDGTYEIFVEYWGDTEQVKIKDLYDADGNLIRRYEYDENGNELSNMPSQEVNEEEERLSVNQTASTLFTEKREYNIQGEMAGSPTLPLNQ